MNTINSIQSHTNSSSSGSTASTGQIAGVMGKDDFLRLLIAQLENQDPLNPLSNEEYINQLTSFSSLEQLTNMTKQLEQMGNYYSQGMQTQSVSLIGKEISALGNNIYLSGTGQEKLRFGYDVPSGSQVELVVRNPSTGYMASLNTPTESGYHEINWDGTIMNDGEAVPLPAGNYELLLVDENLDSLPVYQIGTVKGVDFSTGNALLDLGNRWVSFADVISVRQYEDLQNNEVGPNDGRSR